MSDILAPHHCLRSRAALLAALFLCLPGPAEAVETDDPYAAFSKKGAPGAPGFSKEQLRAKEYFDLGREELSRGENDRALANFDRAIEAAPASGEPYTLKAAALINLERFEEAEMAAHAALERGDKNAYEKLAYAQLEQGSYLDAARSATEAIRQRPRGAQVHAIRAFAYEGLGHDLDKMSDIRMAAKLDPKTFSPRLERALAGGRMFQSRAAARAVRERAGQEISKRKNIVGGAAAIFLTLCVALIVALQFTGKKKESSAVPASNPSTQAPQEEEKLLSGKYELIQVIGKGGMGHVWKAMDHSLNRKVAVKKMTVELGKLGSTAREYYLKEARTVASLDHPHIIGIYEILDLPSGVYLVFELAVGKTVQHIIAEEKHMKLAKVVETMRPVCDALDFAHSRGFVHRDIKPANIMITEQGFVKVMDFGIARRIDERVESPDNAEMPEGPAGLMMARTRTIVGTPQYMPPEAAQGVVSPLTDIYTLGICCYEMLTGVLPFDGSNIEEAKLRRRYKKPSEWVPELTPEVDAFFHDAIDPDPKSRIQTAREFATRLEGTRPA